jgi:DNA-binding beta-propeller fold protein YncE
VINLQFGPRQPIATPTPSSFFSTSAARASGPGTLCAYLAQNLSNTVSVLDVLYRRSVGVIPIEGPGKILLNEDGSRAYVVGRTTLTTIDTQSGMEPPPHSPRTSGKGELERDNRRVPSRRGSCTANEH